MNTLNEKRGSDMSGECKKCGNVACVCDTPKPDTEAVEPIGSVIKEGDYQLFDGCLEYEGYEGEVYSEQQFTKLLQTIKELKEERDELKEDNDDFYTSLFMKIERLRPYQERWSKKYNKPLTRPDICTLLDFIESEIDALQSKLDEAVGLLNDYNEVADIAKYKLYLLDLESRKEPIQVLDRQGLKTNRFITSLQQKGESDE